MSTTPLQPLAGPASSKPINITAQPKDSFWGEDGFTFGDILDIINPLQHIPIVSNIYHALTGDTESTGAKVIGGGLFGGIAGLLVSFVDASISQGGGQTIAERAIAAIAPAEGGSSPEAVRVKDPVEVAELPDNIPPFVPQGSAPSAVPEQTILPENLPGRDIPPVNRAQVQDAIDKYLAATAHIEEDAAQDRTAAIASDLLM